MDPRQPNSLKVSTRGNRVRLLFATSLVLCALFFTGTYFLAHEPRTIHEVLGRATAIGALALLATLLVPVALKRRLPSDTRTLTLFAIGWFFVVSAAFFLHRTHSRVALALMLLSVAGSAALTILFAVRAYRSRSAPASDERP